MCLCLRTWPPDSLFANRFCLYVFVFARAPLANNVCKRVFAKAFGKGERGERGRERERERKREREREKERERENREREREKKQRERAKVRERKKQRHT